MKIKNEMKWMWQRVKNLKHWVNSVYWATKCGYPAKKMTVIGITGTDGKTTTATLIYEILQAVGIKAGLVSTVGVKYLGKEVKKGLHTTNPDAKVLQPLLAEMVKAGVSHLVLEVTAHGLDQYRVWGTNISIGVLTNVTHDHLDDFGNMNRYRKAKAKMFEKVKWAVLNRDEPSYKYFAKKCPPGSQVISYGRAKLKRVSPALEGEYNQYNMAAALAVAEILGVKKEIGEKVMAEFAGVAGRREEVKAGQKFKIFVDFAHTPNALEQLLKSLKTKDARLIVVFGCTGERDKEKRPIMGRIAAELGDEVIITSDDTRGERQDDIYAQIAAGIPESWKGHVHKENERRKAIEMAIEMAKIGDTVVLAGKGHEKSILLGKTEHLWNDVDVAREVVIQLEHARRWK